MLLCGNRKVEHDYSLTWCLECFKHILKRICTPANMTYSSEIDFVEI